MTPAFCRYGLGALLWEMVSGRPLLDVDLDFTGILTQQLTEKEVDLLTAYAEGRGETVGHTKEGLFSRIKSAFS